MVWFKVRDYFLSALFALICSECRCKVYADGVVAEVLARAAAFQEDPYERMLMGRRPDFV